MYSMYDTRGRGDSGEMSIALLHDDEGYFITHEHNARPRVGVSMRVGSMYARTYQSQDWWQTTPIQEIISESENEVVFKTRNGSIYTWKCV